jgi:hypothetical protein
LRQKTTSRDRELRVKNGPECPTRALLHQVYPEPDIPLERSAAPTPRVRPESTIKVALTPSQPFNEGRHGVIAALDAGALCR